MTDHKQPEPVRNPFAPPTPDQPPPAAAPSPALASAPNPFRTGATSASVFEAPPAAGDGTEVANLLARAREIKAAKSALDEEYGKIRARLWDLVGRSFGKIPGGGSFRKLTKRRSVDYKSLEANHPEVYAEVVTITEPDPDQPGALYL